MSNIFCGVTIIANLMAWAADNYLQARRRCAADIALARRDQGWVTQHFDWSEKE
jgi:hypothetical protein